VVDGQDRGVVSALVVALVVAVAWPLRPRRARGRPPPLSWPRWPLLLPLLAVSPALALAAVALVAARPWWRARQDRRRRRQEIVDAVPEAADLLALAVAGGLTVPLAVAVAARWTPGPVGEALGQATREIELGRSTAEALEDVADALGPPARPLVDLLLSSERYGIPLGDGLDRVAREARLERRRLAEERARRVPVLLLFPLVLCVLPAFALLTVVPLLVGSLPDLPP
jgi:tight adherence protein C